MGRLKTPRNHLEGKPRRDRYSWGVGMPGMTAEGVNQKRRKPSVRVVYAEALKTMTREEALAHAAGVVGMSVATLELILK